MGQEAIDKILEAKKQAASPTPVKEKQEDKFFSVLSGEGLHEDFLEIQLRNGNFACFNYNDLLWFNWDPKAGIIDLEFGGLLVTIKGRGFFPKLWNGIKTKRVAWVKEADSDMQDHKDNECFIELITITPQSDASEGEGEEAPA